jgi:hypothetical protein
MPKHDWIGNGRADKQTTAQAQSTYKMCCT